MIFRMWDDQLLHLTLRLARRRSALFVLACLHVVHPFVHGTPLDGGALDTLLMWANAQIVSGTDE